MKKIVLMCLALAMGAGIATAAKPAAGKKIVTSVFVKQILTTVPSLGRGVEEVEVDLATKEVKVTYDASKNNEAQLVKGFASLKVKAEPKPAEEERK